MKPNPVIFLRTGLLVLASLSLFASAATCQPATASNKTSQQASVVILRAQRMLDVKSGRIVSPAVVVIEKDRCF